MQRSESIKAIAEALAKAQKQMKACVKGNANPFFKSKYADLATVAEACMDALNENGIAVLQSPVVIDDGAGVETLLTHDSGEWISGALILPVGKNDAQGVGSAITYARRYALAGFAGVCPEDDDGNAAAKSVRDNGAATPRNDQWLATLKQAAKDGMKEFETVWRGMPNDAKRALESEKNKLKESLLATA